MLYLGSVDEDYAVNASDGSLVWKVHYGYATASSMAFANGVVYFGTTNTHLYALDAGDGNDWACGASRKWLLFAGSCGWGCLCRREAAK